MERNSGNLNWSTGGGLAAIVLWSTTIAVARSLSEQTGPLTAGACVYLIGGALCSFPGLLLVVAIHFAQSVKWDIPHLALAVAAFSALRLEVNILWVVILGTGLSLIFCR